MTHICVGKETIIGSDNGLSPGRRQAIIWTNAGILLIGPLGTHFSEISIKILTFSLTKMRLKVSSTKWRPFCLGLNVLRDAHVPGQPHRSSSLCRRLRTMRPFSPSLANLASRGKPDLFCWIYFVFNKKDVFIKKQQVSPQGYKTPFPTPLLVITV